MSDVELGRSYEIEQKSSKPSPSGEKGLGKIESEALTERARVKMVFEIPGEPPSAPVAVLQLRGSFALRFGLMRSSDLPFVSVTSG